MKLLIVLIFLSCFFLFIKDINAKSSKMLVFDEKKSFSLILDIADDFKSKKLGLMHKKKLKDSNGMIFLYDVKQVVNIWMKNTLLDLDIIFINSNIILSIKNGNKLSTNIISSKKIVDAVIEIPKNCSKKLKLKRGKKIFWRKLEYFDVETLINDFPHSFPCTQS
tara:strand:+ start:76664 stop:77158 length:495 start_codon:yes stop_codon:yes gene_type:complete